MQSVVINHDARPPRAQRARRLGVTLGAVALLAAGLYGLKAIADDGSGTATAQATAPTATSDQATTATITPVKTSVDRPAVLPGDLDVAAVTATISPSVVKVSVDVSNALGDGEGVGTGVIISADGNILTNAHVVADATEVRVLLFGQTEPVAATVIGTDPGNDLALIDIDGDGHVAAGFADAASVFVGDPVVAIGYALDLPGEASVTNGIISALSRTMLTDEGALDGLLQTDAAISSGNSGGPLVDAFGLVVGINTAVARGSQTSAANNIGFAISVPEILTAVEQLKANGGQPRVQGYLGIGTADRHDGGRGAIVTEVEPGSPADALGLEVNDVVSAVDGVIIDGQAGLIAAIRDHAPGDTVVIDFSRDREVLSGTTVLVDRPAG